GRCEIWTGTQVLARAQAGAAAVTGLPLDKVIAHNHYLGGGFGRRLEFDNVPQAVRIAQQVDGPVKVIWTREEDIQHDVFRPYYYDRFSAALNAQGQPIACMHRIVGPSILARYLPPLSRTGSTSTRWMERRSCSTTSPRSGSSTCATRSRCSTPGSGGASASPTATSWSRASSTSWLRPRSRIRWPIGGHSSRNRPARRRSLTSRPRRPDGGSRCPKAGPAGA